MIVTIDGAAGTGKTTVAKRVAEALHFNYFDTGAMYRAVAWGLLKNHIALDDVQAIERFIKHFHFRIEEGKERRYFLGDEDVTKQIRLPEITKSASIIAVLKPVRESLWKIQKAFAEGHDVVFEGRDLGSVVFPHAEIKIFLTASPEIRAQRRLEEMLQKKMVSEDPAMHAKVLADIKQRDHADSTRTLAPLKCPEGAHVIDTSYLSLDQVVLAVLEYIRKKGIVI